MSENKELTVNTSNIDNEIVSLANQVLEETDPETAKKLVDLFNWNLTKKNTSRILKLNDLYDNVTDQMVTRFRTRADQFSNSDLLDYMKAIQGAIDSSTKTLSGVNEVPTIIQQNNTEINVTVEETFDHDAKVRILEAVQQAIRSAKTPAEHVVEPENFTVSETPEASAETFPETAEETSKEG